MNPKYYNEKICVVCKSKFYVPVGKNSRGRPAGVRQSNAITCSKECAKVRARSL